MTTDFSCKTHNVIIWGLKSILNDDWEMQYI